jgi:hypothetical protein
MHSDPTELFAEFGVSGCVIIPNTEGPRMMPATSWSITANWPMRCIASPSSRPIESRRTI